MKIFFLIFLLITIVIADSFTDTCSDTNTCLTGLVINSNFTNNNKNATYTLVNPSISCNVTVILMALPGCVTLTRASSTVRSISIAEDSAALFNDTCSNADPYFDCWYENETITNGTCFSGLNETYSDFIVTYRIEIYPNTTTFSLFFDLATDIIQKPVLLTPNGSDPCSSCQLHQPYVCTESSPGSSPSPPTIYDISHACDVTPTCISGTKLTAFIFTTSIVYEITRIRSCSTNTFYVPIPTEFAILSTACVFNYYPLALVSSDPCAQNTVLSFPGYNTYQFFVNGLCSSFTINLDKTINASTITRIPSQFSGYDPVLNSNYCGSGCLLPAITSNYNASYQSECGSGAGCIANAPISAKFFTDYIHYEIGHTCANTIGLFVDFWLPIPTENTIRTSNCVLGYGEVTVAPCDTPVTFTGYRTYKIVLNSTCTGFNIYINNYFNPDIGDYFSLPLQYRITSGDSFSSICTICSVPVIGISRVMFTTSPLTTSQIQVTTSPLTTNKLTTGRISAVVTTGEITSAPIVTTSPLTTGLASSYSFTGTGCDDVHGSCIRRGSIIGQFFPTKIIYTVTHTCSDSAIFYIPIPNTIAVTSTLCVFASGTGPQTFGSGCPVDGRYSGYTLYSFSLSNICTTFTVFLNDTIDHTKYQLLTIPARASGGSTSSICMSCVIPVPFEVGFVYTSGSISTSAITTSPLTTGALTTGQRPDFFPGGGLCASSIGCFNSTIVLARFYPTAIEYYWEPVNCQSIKIRVPIPNSLTIHSIECGTITTGSVEFNCGLISLTNYTTRIIDVEFACSSVIIHFESGDFGYDYTKITNVESGVFTQDDRVQEVCQICSIPILNINSAIVYTTGSFTTHGLTTNSDVTTGKVRVTTGAITTSPLFNDCNKNGILDEIEIQGHFVKDRNNNGIPDECEGLDNIYFVSQSFLTLCAIALVMSLVMTWLYCTVFPFFGRLIRRIDGTLTREIITPFHGRNEEEDLETNSDYSSNSQEEEEQPLVKKKQKKPVENKVMKSHNVKPKKK
jgi:hypothetical protein